MSKLSKTAPSAKSAFALFEEGVLTSTKETAKRLGITTPKAYILLSQLEKEGKISKVGYRTKNGTEHYENSPLKPNSLCWSL